MSYAPATRLTRVELDAARVITTGSIRITGILVSNDSGGNVEVVFRDNDGTEILSIAVLAADSKSFEVPWIADNGLNIDSASSADVSVTVSRGFEGA